MRQLIFGVVQIGYWYTYVKRWAATHSTAVPTKEAGFERKHWGDVIEARLTPLGRTATVSNCRCCEEPRYTSVCSAISSASSTSRLRLRTVLSSLP